MTKQFTKKRYATVKVGNYNATALMTLEEATRRYANAKRRALYWSGVPSFNEGARSQETSSSRACEKYELAMCDCRSWEEVLKELTGKTMPRYDPRTRFQSGFGKLISKKG